MIEKTLINPNLYVLCQEAQELILDGYRFKEGFPDMYGWQYHAVLERVEQEEVATKSVGRPVKSAPK